MASTGWDILPISRTAVFYDGMHFYIGTMTQDPPAEYDRAGDVKDAQGYPMAGMPIGNLFLEGSVTISYASDPDQVFQRGDIYNRKNIYPNRTNQVWSYPVRFLSASGDTFGRSWSVSAAIVGAGNKIALNCNEQRLLAIIGEGTGTDDASGTPYEPLSIVDLGNGDQAVLNADTETAMLILRQV